MPASRECGGALMQLDKLKCLPKGPVLVADYCIYAWFVSIIRNMCGVILVNNEILILNI